MPTYEYRCGFCGPFNRVLSIRDVTATSTCPDCGESATRVFSTPTLIARTSPLRRAVQAAERSAHEPGVAVREAAPPAEPARLPERPADLSKP